MKLVWTSGMNEHCSFVLLELDLYDEFQAITISLSRPYGCSSYKYFFPNYYIFIYDIFRFKSFADSN